MRGFQNKNGSLHAEGVSLEALAKRHGTPLYVYSLHHILDNYQQLTRAFRGMDHLVCFSMKANSNLGILAALAKAGCGFDIVSAGELHRLRAVGADMRKVIFAGVGKTRDEIAQAIRAGIYMFNIESWPEAEAINAVAAKLGKVVKVDFRINPDVDAKTHAYISTAKKASKFGLPYTQAKDLFARARSLKNLRVSGIHLHIGSQITELGPFKAAAKKAMALIHELRAQGHTIETLNLGGGLGIVYNAEKAKSAAQYAAALLPIFKGSGLKLLFEPGRYFVGNAGVLLTRVLYLKETDWKDFVIVDAAMNDLIRPSLYDAYHAIVPVRPRAGGRVRKVDVVGPICESGDFLAQDRRMPLPRQDDLLAILSAGAYGFVMASNYNSRGRAAEIVVDGKRAHVTRKRETQADLIRGESVPKAWRPSKKKRA